MQLFKSIIIYQNSPKIKLFWKKMQNFQALGAPPPDPKTQPPIANFWLRAWQLVLFLIICVFAAFVLSNFFLIVQLQI